MSQYTLWVRVALCFGVISFQNAMAGPQTATLTNLVGTVEVLKHPASKISGEGVHVRFRDKYFIHSIAKPGDRIETGEVVRTLAESKARLIFENGDQMNVGALTSFVMEPPPARSPASPTLNLSFGKIRAVIDKDGPRNRLKIRMKAATMGVRGTDFLISDEGSEGQTELQVFRGKVEVRPETNPQEAQLITRGSAAVIPHPEAPPPAKKEPVASSPEPAAPPPKPTTLVVRKVSKEDLVEAHQELYVPSTPEGSAAVPELKKLEEKAVASTLKDLKRETPEVVRQLKNETPPSAQMVNAEVLAALFDTAERRNPDSNKVLVKPSSEEVEKQINEAYQNLLRR
jgi:hypothetical protein